ncbi:MAG: ComF family protein [Steroidobacteraceae bacterium]
MAIRKTGSKYLSGEEGCQPADRFRVYGLLELALARFFPPRCLFCLGPGQAPDLDLCAGCEADLLPNVPACTVCAQPLKTAGSFLCPRCAARPRAFDAAFAGCRYAWPLDWAVQRAKYSGDIAAAAVLGRLLARRLPALQAAHVDALLPVPLHRAREAQRGYNQAHEIACQVGRRLGLPVVSGPFERIRATPAQAGLDAAARRRNLKGAFARRGPWPYRRVAIIDDVMTTGTTVEALAELLREAGSEWIEVWVLARA